MPSPGPIDPSQGNFQGLLLAAHPDLKDPNFRRSVLYLTVHDAEAGALGFVLNRPLGKNAAELLPGHEEQELLQRVPVYLGGPVGHGQLGFADLSWDAQQKTMQLNTNLSLEEVSARLEEQSSSVRAFVGYAGWAVGQLEGELDQKSWVLVRSEGYASESERVEKLWFQIMSSLGPTYKLLAAVPDDPALN